MKTEIVKTRTQAIKAAKDNCRNESGKSKGTYLLRQMSAYCNCGESPAIEITMFTGKNYRNQTNSRVGYCKNCAK